MVHHRDLPQPTAPRGEVLARALPVLAALVLATWSEGVLADQPVGVPVDDGQPRATKIGLTIREFRVEGSSALPREAMERALDPFLGPGRVLADVESARQALLKAYEDAGFQGVSVEYPRQSGRDGVIILQVVEPTVERLRVRGADWFLPSEVRKLAPTMAEGQVPEWRRMMGDIVALNQLPDRRVQPVVNPGSVPGRVNIDLVVEDTFPLHGALELNNRHGQFTRPLRLAGSLRYANLWQLGHTLGASFQVAPQSNDGDPGGGGGGWKMGGLTGGDPDPDARVISGTYSARFDDPSWLSMTASATYQDSTLSMSSAEGGLVIKSSGHSAGVHATLALPGTDKVFHNVTLGVDYKKLGQDMKVGSKGFSVPLTYWPWSVQYTLAAIGAPLDLTANASVTGNIRPLSGSQVRWDDRRYKATAAFIVLRGDLAVTRELRFVELYAKVLGQYAWDPLISSEQLSAGGADTVRGYLESAVVGDYGGLLILEARSPSLAPEKSWIREARVLVFADGALLETNEPLPEQKSRFWLASAGLGARLETWGFLTAEVDVGLPFVDEATSKRFHPRAHFRVASEF